MFEYITSVIVWICISSAVSIVCKDNMMQNGWLTSADLEKIRFNGKKQAFIQFIAINMIPIFRLFVCIAMILMASIRKDDKKL